MTAKTVTKQHEKKGGYDKFVSSPTLLRHNNHQWLKNIFLSFCNMIP